MRNQLVFVIYVHRDGMCLSSGYRMLNQIADEHKNSIIEVCTLDAKLGEYEARVYI